MNHGFIQFFKVGLTVRSLAAEMGFDTANFTWMKWKLIAHEKNTKPEAGFEPVTAGWKTEMLSTLPRRCGQF